jgi:hypothetical protein
MAKIGFNIALIATDDNKLAELRERAADLSPVFERVIDEWAKGNVGKFKKAKGAETGGVSQDSDAYWMGLTEKYRKQKEKEGFTDWLMVRSGELMASLTDREGFINMVGPTTAAFGTPWSSDNEAKIAGNWDKRPSVFLNKSDTFMIDRNVQDYFSLGPDFAAIRMAEGYAAIAAKEEAAQWGIDFNAALRGD